MRKLLTLLFLFQIVLLTTSCSSKSKPKNTDSQESKNIDTKISQNTEKINFNIFIENSGSMKGYLKPQQSSFRNSLYQVIGSCKPAFTNSINFSLTAKPESKKISRAEALKYATTLNERDFSEGSTDLPFVLKNCLKDLRTNDVSFVISDYITSTKSNQLESAEQSIRDVISKIQDSVNIGVVVIKSVSYFDGKYNQEALEGKAVQFTRKRPFYILIFGTDENLLTTLNNLDIKSLDGYENSIVFLSDYSKTLKGKINTKLINENRAGSYKIEAPASSMNIVDFKYSSETPTQFSIAINFSKINFPKEYFLDISNYFISDDYKIQKIEPYSKDGYTNKIIVKTTKVIANKDSMIIGLKKYNLPFWVDSTTTIDDNINSKAFEKQTYGIKYLLSGISQAFKDLANYNQNEYTKITTVKFYTERNSKNGGSNTLIFSLIITLILAVLLLIFLKNKSK